ncbi:MAG: hypothetical protein AAFR88_03075 [Pseudomonadota bacterium]
MSQGTTREERLATKLRENLRRRKAQSREMNSESPDESGHNGVAKPGDES